MPDALAYSGSTWTQVIVGLSIFVPLTIAAVVTIVVLRGAKNDPDEKRWRLLEEERARAEATDKPTNPNG